MRDNQMQVMRTSTSGLVLGALFLAIGFWGLITFEWAWWGLLAGGALAWLSAFNKDSLQAFSFPRKPWLILVGALFYLVISIAIGTIASYAGFDWAANPATGQLDQLIFMLPLMLLGEELLGVGILEGARSKGLSFWTSSFLSALVFGLIHMQTYWDGSFGSTLLHVLLLQGISRLIFNYIYWKTKRSIWGSWISHLLVDVISLAL